MLSVTQPVAVSGFTCSRNRRPRYDRGKRRQRRGHPGDCREGGVAGGEPDGIEFGWKAGRFAETRHARGLAQHRGVAERRDASHRRDRDQSGYA